MDPVKALAIVGRPLVAFALFLSAALLARAITRRMRPSGFKRLLTMRLTDNWWGVAWCLVATLVLWTAIYLADPLPH